MGYRRRRIRRILPFRRWGPRPLANKALRELKRAHLLKEEGRHLEAAIIFEQLALGAQMRNLPQHPLLLLQAGRSHIQGGKPEKGVHQIKTAIGVLVETGQAGRAAQLRPGLQALFETHNLESSWQEIENLLQQAGVGPQPHTINGLKLPSKCPYCGASLVPEELGEVTREEAVCGYCGSYVQAGDKTP